MMWLINKISQYIQNTVGIKYFVSDEGVIGIPIWIKWQNQERDPTKPQLIRRGRVVNEEPTK